jgi:hypothetical protein
MADYLTVCLADDEETIKAYLTSHSHSYVDTFGPFQDGDLILCTNDNPPPRPCGGLSDSGAKVLVHTRGP